jgi:hypothetical protein
VTAGTVLTRRIIALTGSLLTLGAIGCRFLESGPSDDEVVAAVRSAPPAPPTIGPTYLATLDAVEVRERGRYNAKEGYWPVKVFVKGGTKVKVTNAFQLGLLGDPHKEQPEPAEFAEEARLRKDDFGQWRIRYEYAATGPAWRLNEPERSSAAR